MAVYHDQSAQELDSPQGIVGTNRGGTGQSLSDDGPGVLVQASLGAAVTVVPLSGLPSGILPLVNGGLAADFSAAGPGFAYQSALGAAFESGLAHVYDMKALGLVVNSSAAAAANATLWSSTLSAIAAGSAKSAIIVLPPGEIYVNAECQVTSSFGDAKTLMILGCVPGYNNTGGTWLRASTSMRSVLAVLAPRIYVFGVGVNADRLATYGSYLSACARSLFSWCHWSNAVVDGVHFPASGNNNDVKFDHCMSYLNGVTYVTSGISAQYTNGTRTAITGTAEATAGNVTINIAGSSTDLTTLPLRKGDIIRVGDVRRTLANTGVADYTAGSDYMLIDSVTATSVVVQANASNRPTFTATGLNFAIFCGDGFRDIRNADTNNVVFDNCYGSLNGGSGVATMSLYGPRINDGNYSYNNAAGIMAGHSDNTSSTDGVQCDSVYIEDVGGAYFLGQTAKSVNITSPRGIKVEDPGSELFYICRLGRGLVRGDGVESSVELGTYQSFVVQVRNNGGTIEHRIVDEIIGGSGCNAALISRITGASTTYATTPSVAAGVAFTNGLGIDNTAAQYLILDQKGTCQDIDVTALVESDSSGAVYDVAVTTRSVNVNGVTKARLAFQLNAAGVATNWAAANITAGGWVAFRVRGRIR